MVDDTGVFELDDKLVKLTGHDVPEFYDTEAQENTPCLFLKAARIKEKMSTLTETTLEFISKDKELDLDLLLGKNMTIELYDDEENLKRRYNGFVVSIEYLGPFQKYALYTCQIRPWFWFLTKRQNSKVFQNLNTIDIALEIFGEHGFGDYRVDASGTYDPREYTIQYNETDYEFICRLFEEEGIYFHYDDSDEGVNKLVLADDSGSHSPVEGGPSFKFYRKDDDNRPLTDHIYDFSGADVVTSGKAVYRDYNFTTSTADLTGETTIEKGTHSHKSYEVYHYPAHSEDADGSTKRSRARAEGNAIGYQVRKGASNIEAMSPGWTFQIEDHPSGDDTTEYLLTGATHAIAIKSEGAQKSEDPLLENRLQIKGMGTELYRCIFECTPKLEPFRPPRVHPWPEMPGLLTAMVVGPEGDEIHTDEYGRIKVQFHWDRLGESNEQSCCFIRTVMPWTGKDWGMIAIPRIGSEVIIQFENGNPDRPICTGMVYNDQYMPPYALDTNKTMTGIKTRSTPGGNENTFHELVFEDKFEEEYVRFQSERDYIQIIKNNADITIGIEHNDEGNLTQTVQNSKTETIKDGDDTLTVETGNRVVTIETGDYTETVQTGNYEKTIETGNHSTSVDTGNHDVTVSQGNKGETVSAGDYSISVDAGTLSIEAGTEISLTVGSNSITIDTTGITISGAMVTVEGTASVDIGSPATTVSADGMLTLDGGTTLIN